MTRQKTIEILSQLTTQEREEVLKILNKLQADKAERKEVKTA